jgi:hypothetical protein
MGLGFDTGHAWLSTGRASQPEIATEVLPCSLFALAMEAGRHVGLSTVLKKQHGLLSIWRWCTPAICGDVQYRYILKSSIDSSGTSDG